ncbi:hypothetical protein [Prochlorococcus marinus]|uniref:hypothetical protein n=1 Tax=Prochlorococcus marinus TaxID=1219 RepID=UPI001ADB5EDE|nr:hypothetical protein [Prochlorococcus marinus]MBO8204236.1 hypothetical protein [Prochlorococcus marinus CUG1415]MBW3043537.1 hypothetical protein [Prochlorococcus marinus str. MU1415]
MQRRKSKLRKFQPLMFFLIGFIMGIGAIWPGMISEPRRKCFFEIIKDGSDGSVSLGTIFSISPNYLLRIRNEKNKYNKVLLIGDFCFRKAK